MDVRHPLNQITASLLMALLFLDPLLVRAAELALDGSAGNASLGQAGNGVPLVNISTPNGSGLSHNKFTDYNVAQQGLILNNGTQPLTPTQLGGYIPGNANLSAGSANLILNEVNGGNASRLNGYTEVAGQAAHVIVANPHGITCDGCGFINTPRATLTTGTPRIDNGVLKGYDVDGGKIAIEGAGVNATNVDQFELITRAAEINAQVHAGRLDIVTGRNEVDARTLDATAKADGGSKPGIAIDSSALGGMYAGAIRLVGTEAGVGVKLAGDLAASAGDIHIDANGHLTMARTAAAGHLALKAQDIALQGDAYAAGNASIQTDRLDVQQSLAAGNGVQIAARSLNNPGTIEAGVHADGSTNTGSELRLDGGAVHNSGQLVSHGSLITDLQQFDNTGQVVASGAAQVDVQQLNNTGGTLVGQQQMNVNASHLDNRGGTLAGNRGLNIHVGERLDNRADGLILSQAGGLTLEAGTLDNQQGVIQANSGPLDIASQSLVNDQGRIATAAGALSLHADNLSNREGQLIADRAALSIDAGRIDNGHGRIHARELDVTASVRLLNDHGRLLATRGVLTLEAGEILNRSGYLQAAGLLDVGGASLSNQAGVLGGTRVQLDLRGALNNDNGLVEAADTLQLAAAGVSNKAGQLRALGSAGESRFAIGGWFDNDAGLVEIGNERFVLASDELSNQNGSVRHLGSHFGVDLQDVGLAGGSFISNGELHLSAADWTNTSLLQARKLTLAIGQFVQGIGGRLLASESIIGTGESWHNDGAIETDGSLKLTFTGSYNGNGDLLAQGDVRVSAANAELGAAAQLQAGGNMQLDVQQLMLSAGIITAGGSLTLAAPSVVNQGTLGAAGGVRVAASTLRNEQGLIFSGDDMLLLADHFANRYGDVYSLGQLWLARDEAGSWSSRLDNHSGTVESAGDLTLRATQIENRRDVLETSQAKYAASITELPCRGAYNPGGDCDLGSNGRKIGAWQVDERDRLEVTASSAAARMIAGGNLDIQGADLLNSSSTIAAAGDMQMQLQGLQQKGFEPGEIWTTRVFTSGRKPDYYFYRDAANAFNAAHADTPNLATLTQDLNHFVGLMENEYRPYAATQRIQTAGQSYAAQIQAGGDVHILTSAGFDSSVVRPSYDYVGGGNRATDTGVGTSIATPVSLNSQLPADLSQRAVDPLTLPGFSLPAGQNGLFQIGAPDHPYLVETNPALASLDNFLSSDYMLGLLGYDERTTQRRLGDGLYEQRLIREAILARTGKRFLVDALASDEAQFRYLMNNALASKEALDLSVGVALSAEQVAALTHDIVWMEEREINGQSVLAPVLYLAQANDRIAANGALVQGRDLALISGASLRNQGILRASQALGIAAQTDVLNSGLMQADGRLALLAGDSVRNRDGGILKGSGVNVAALTGDLLNQRSVSQHHSTTSRTDHLRSFVDSAARIEADNDLQLSAGGDLHNLGGAIIAGGGAQLDAGRDLVIASAEEQNRDHRTSKGGYSKSSDITQHRSELQIDGAVAAVAGRDMAIVASTLKAGESIDLLAAGDVTIAAAANETHRDYRHKGGDKKVESQRHTINQQAAAVEAGSTLDVTAGGGLTVLASRLSAGKEAYLHAGGDLNLDAAQDQDYSYSYKKKKSGGLFGSSKSTMSEASTSQAAISSIDAGSDLVLIAEDNIAVRGAQLSSDEHISLHAGRIILLDSAENTESETSTKSKSKLFSSKASYNSSEATSLTGSRLEGKTVGLAADQDIALRAATVRSEQGIALRAGRDIAVTTAQQRQESSRDSKSSKLNWHLTDSLATNGSFTVEQKASAARSESTQEVGSTLSGGFIDLTSGRDSTIVGSTLVADENVNIRAGRNLALLSAQRGDDSSASSQSKNTGEVGSWYQGATGVVSAKKRSDSQSIRQLGSQVASLGGSVQLEAGENYRQQASEVIAAQGDVDIAAKRVDIQAGFDLLSSSQKQSHSRTAIGGSVSVPLIDAVRGMGEVARAAKDADDGRLKALAMISTAMSARHGYRSAQAIADGNLSGIKISVNLSDSRSENESRQSGQNVVGSQITAGRDINIKASGDGADSDLTIVGSTLDAERNVNLDAEGDLSLRSAQNTADQEGSNRSDGWSVGVGFALGSQNGFTLDLAANRGRGASEGKTVTHTNTEVRAGETATLYSGGDTNVIGAVVSADKVNGFVGGDFNLASQQDVERYKSDQKDASVGVSVCIPPFCYGTSSSGSASFNQQKINSEYASVREQSGIKAADGGFQFEVVGNTDLKGAVIASSDQAALLGRNSLTTGTLSYSDIKNEADADASSSGLTLGSEALTPGKYSALKSIIRNSLYDGDASDNSAGETRSAISQGLITITNEAKQFEKTGQSADEVLTGLSRDTEETHVAARHLDFKRLADEAEAERIIKKAIYEESFKYTDDAYRTMFLEKITMYEVLRDSEGKIAIDKNGRPLVRELSQEEKYNLKPGSSGRVKVFTNGIFNDELAAQKYAAQMIPGGIDAVYLVAFPPAETWEAELMVAGYQKFLENDLLGLANATVEVKRIMKLYGKDGLDLTGHSRGSMTVGNAMESLKREGGGQGVLNNTDVRFVGPAYNAKKAAGLLYELSDGKQDAVYLENHADDFVGSILGWNPATFDAVPDGSYKVKEWLNMFRDSPTTHSCYGAGTEKCDASYGRAVTLEIKHHD